MAIEKAGVELTAIDSASRVFNQVGAAAKNLEKAYSSLQNVFVGALAVLAIDKIVDATIEWERSSNRLTATLRATGGAVGITRHELDEMAVSMSRTTEFSARQFTNAEAALISFGGIHEDVFKGALKDVADVAAKMSIDLVSAAHLVGRAYQDPVLGLRALQKELGTLTFTQKDYIAQLEAAGKVEEAQLVIHNLIQSRIGGTAELMNTGLTKAVKDNQKAWEELETSLGNFAKGAIVGSANALSNWVHGVEDVVAAARAGRLSLNPAVNRTIGQRTSSGSIRSSAEEAAAAAAAAADREVLAQNRIAEAHQKAIPVLATWNKMLGDQTNEQRALDLVLRGEARSWNDLDKAKLLNIAVELDYRRVFKDRMELAAMEAKAMRDATLGEEENLATRVRVIETDWARGTRETFRDYIDHATNAAEQASMLFTNAFKNMEDGLVSFVMTGKLDFRSFADSVISDLIRIQVRQALAGFASSSSNFFAGLGGSVDAYPGLQSHRGGIVGIDTQPRMVNPAWFHGAPRMHMGGLAGDEVPVILQRGERVIPRGGSSGLAIHIHQNIGGNVTRADLAATAEAARRGTLVALAEERRRDPSGPYGG